ncbi:M-phase inducer phosphatase 3 [Nematocida sp. AWRm77]|nr:M-phase inducer phosphatase 3 [Nematocida sp. AWRm77]
MSDLGSEVDIIASDKEMEEIGQCLAGKAHRVVPAEMWAEEDKEEGMPDLFRAESRASLRSRQPSRTPGKKQSLLRSKRAFSLVFDCSPFKTEEGSKENRPLRKKEERPSKKSRRPSREGEHGEEEPGEEDWKGLCKELPAESYEAHGKKSTEKNLRSALRPQNINAQHWSKKEGVARGQTYAEGMPPVRKNAYEDLEKYSTFLPSVGLGPSDGILRVTAETVADLIKRKHKFMLLDCRFEYEYQGGHIVNSLNIMTMKDTCALFHKVLKTDSTGEDTVFIFYCEYSSVRAPRLATYLRNEDRRSSTYPYLNFPNVYVMNGGYKEFYRKYPELCMPQSYTPM